MTIDEYTQFLRVVEHLQKTPQPRVTSIDATIFAENLDGWLTQLAARIAVEVQKANKEMQ